MLTKLLKGDQSSLQFGLSLHPHPFLVYASSEGSDETVHTQNLPCICEINLREAHL